MNRTLTITYNWKEVDGNPIKKSHQEALEESAMDRILYQYQEGITSGELHDNIFMDDDDPEDGISYQGWYDIKFLNT